jgi:hypothetical protein
MASVFFQKLKQFLWYMISGKNPENERKKEEMTRVLQAIKEEKQKNQIHATQDHNSL